MALIGGQINPALYPQPDYRNVIEADRMRAQSFIDVGASIGNVIKDFSEAKKESKKVDADNKASVKAIEAAITLGGSYGITGAENTLRPFLEAYNDPNLSPIEKAALLDEGKKMIPNVFGRFDASQADAIQRAQLNARNAPQPVPLDFKPVDIAMVVNGVKGTKRVLEDANTGRIRTSDGKEYRNIEDAKAGINPINQGYNDTQIGIDNALSMPSSSGEYDPTAASVLLGGDYPDGVVSIGSPAPLGAATTTEVPQVDGPPITNVPKTPLNKESISKFPNDFIPDDVKESYRPFTPEEITRYGSDGQVSSTGRVYPIRPPSGTEFTTNPDGSVTYRTGSGFGDKDKKAVDSKIDKAMSLTQDLNLLEDRTKSMASGVVGAVGRMAAEQIPGTFQAENKEVIDRVIATLTLENLQAMRNNSPTGASLGNISDKDTGLMRDSATSLKNAQSPESFKKELVRLKNLQHDVIYGSKRVLEQKLNKGEITKAQFDEAMANAPSEYLDERGAIRTKKIKGSINTLSSESQDIYKEFGIE